ncbi:hypothetical protein NL676_031604 [Syzygium grande]|nr:hypothetical protein NL676_031604 [Syzygium grande]
MWSMEIPGSIKHQRGSPSSSSPGPSSVADYHHRVSRACGASASSAGPALAVALIASPGPGGPPRPERVDRTRRPGAVRSSANRGKRFGWARPGFCPDVETQRGRPRVRPKAARAARGNKKRRARSCLTQGVDQDARYARTRCCEMKE